METLELPFSEVNTEADALAGAKRTPLDLAFEQKVQPIQKHFEFFVASMGRIFSAHEEIGKNLEYFYSEHDDLCYAEKCYQHYLNVVKKIATDALGEMGISNFNLEDPTSRHYQKKDFPHWESPKAYWHRITSDIEKLRFEGLSKHARRLRDELLGLLYEGERVSKKKGGFVVEVSAWTSSYSWESGYTYDCQRSLMAILDSLREVVIRNEIDSFFHTHSVNRQLENFESRAKVDFCEGVVVQTFKSKVLFQLSFDVMEAIQLFIAEFAGQEKG
jgi:hypothetical protein